MNILTFVAKETTMDNIEIKKVLKKGQWRNLIIVGAIVILLFAFKPWVQVGAGQRGIVQNFGAVRDIVLNEAIYFRVKVIFII